MNVVHAFIFDSEGRRCEQLRPHPKESCGFQKPLIHCRLCGREIDSAQARSSPFCYQCETEQRLNRKKD